VRFEIIEPRKTLQVTDLSRRLGFKEEFIQSSDSSLLPANVKTGELRNWVVEELGKYYADLKRQFFLFLFKLLTGGKTMASVQHLEKLYQIQVLFFAPLSSYLLLKVYSTGAV
jgi:ribosomal protein L29